MAFTPSERPYDVQHYGFSFEMDPGADPKTFPATIDIELRVKTATNTIELDAESLQVESVELVGPKPKPLTFKTEKDDRLVIALPSVLKPGTSATLRIHYSAKINSAHSGIFRVTDPDMPERGPLFFTQLEPLHARKLFPSNDQPFDKATNTFRAVVPKGYSVIANGKLKSEKAVTKSGKKFSEFHWELKQPHSTYLVALAVGKFKSLKSGRKGPEISMWVGDGQEKKAKFALDATVSCLNYFEKFLGVKYPWPKYATVGVPTFLWGGMENTSSTHMNQERTLLSDESSEMDKNLIVGLASHELAHQWFGDYVTMRWWDDIWLNEAFASHLGTLGTKNFFKNEEAELEMVVDTWDDYFRQEDGPRSHPIITKELAAVDDAFDSINYTKGENILRMLSFYIGEKKFRAGLKDYLKTHSLDNATYQDFFASMEKMSKEKLSQFRDSWILQRGYPILTYSGDWDSKKSQYTLTLEQQSNHPEDRTKFSFRIPITFHRTVAPKFAVAGVMEVTDTTTTFSTKLPGEPQWVTVNNRSVVLGRVVPKKRNDEVLSLQAKLDPDPFVRVWATYALISDYKETGKLSADAEAGVLDVLHTDSSPYVRNAVAEALQKMKPRFLTKNLGVGVLAEAQTVLQSNYRTSKLYKTDPHGWAQWRSQALGTLGKVEDASVLPLLAKTLAQKTLPVDDLNKASAAVGLLGDEKSAGLLREAMTIHGGRSYRHKFVVMNAFGALEHPGAADEIREIAKTAGSDFMGRIGRVVKNNQVLKNSDTWSKFLQDFILHDQKFGDEVKARILQTIEEVKKPHVEKMLQTVKKESASERMRGLADNILTKNF